MKSSLWFRIAAPLGVIFVALVASGCVMSGGLRDEEQEISIAELPEGVVQAIHHNYPGAEILEAEIEIEDGQKLYEVEIELGNQKLEVELAPSFEIVEVELEDDDEDEDGGDGEHEGE